MELIVDGVTSAAKLSGDPQAVLAAHIEQLGRQGRVVKQFILNGQDVTHELARFLPTMNKRDRIALVSVPASQLLSESLKNMLDALPQLHDDIRQTVIFMQTGQDEKAFSLLATVTDGLQAYIQLLGLVAQHIPTRASAANKHVAQITHWLQDTLSAWRSNDLVLVADYLFYEIMPQIERGEPLLAAMLQTT